MSVGSADRLSKVASSGDCLKSFKLYGMALVEQLFCTLHTEGDSQVNKFQCVAVSLRNVVAGFRWIYHIVSSGHWFVRDTLSLRDACTEVIT